MVVLENVTFTPESVSVRNFVKDCESGMYNLDPIHQRNVIHPENWQSGIIDSIYCVGDIPGVYFHPVNDLHTAFDSLDGKQRCTSLIRFVQGKVRYNGKYYKDTDPKIISKIMTTKINVICASRKLTDKEIEKFFLSRQYASNTKLGEKLNSQITTSARKFLKDILEDEEEKESEFSKNLYKLKSSNNRYEHLEIISRLLYCWLNHASGKIDIDGEKKIMKWYNEIDCDSICADAFMKDVGRLLRLMAVLGVKYSGSKTVYIPFFAAILAAEENAGKIKKYYIDGNKFNFPDVAGNHNITKTRYNEIMRIINKL